MGHTYYSAADLQLFLLAILAIYLIQRKPWLGFAYCLFLILLGNGLIFYLARKYETQPFITTPVIDHR